MTRIAESAPTLRRVYAMRRFNRFYTRQIGVLDDAHLGSEFSLAEARVLYELAHGDHLTASALGLALGLDAGYLSRMLRGFRRRGLVRDARAAHDARVRLLRLTPAGLRAFAALDAQTTQQIAALLGGLPNGGQRRLLAAMRDIEEILAPATAGPPGATDARYHAAPAAAAAEPITLRRHRPGDMGWIVHRHGVLYSEEYGWDERFEALVATVVGDFVTHFKPRRERCWIAERQGETIGCIFLVQQSRTVAKLRLLLVEPSARGTGVGRTLVHECLRFARSCGYRTVTLWTNAVLHAARRIYEREGFRLVHSEQHHLFGRRETGQTWELNLRALPSAPRSRPT